MAALSFSRRTYPNAIFFFWRWGHVSKRDYADAQYTNNDMADDYGVVFSTGKITTKNHCSSAAAGLPFTTDGQGHGGRTRRARRQTRAQSRTLGAGPCHRHVAPSRPTHQSIHDPSLVQAQGIAVKRQTFLLNEKIEMKIDEYSYASTNISSAHTCYRSHSWRLPRTGRAIFFFLPSL